MRSAETELQNTIELRATASAIAAPKPDLDAKAEKLDDGWPESVEGAESSSAVSMATLYYKTIY